MTEQQNWIDIRSDTVTKPCEQMRHAMATADVGDDVYGDDPTVNRLQSVAAEMLGHEAGLFLPSGTQSNLVALLTHCARGDEYIVGADAHTYKYEGGGAAVLGGIQPQTVAFDKNGELPLDQVASVIKPDDVHFANTHLLCLENTQHGRVQSLDYMRRAQRFAAEHKLILHLDGARAGNAAVALDTSLEEVGRCFDTVSLCLSKGLGAPVGSVLVGSRDFIATATRWRKVTGGGMRQAGVIAAAGLVALEIGVARLQQDHENAQHLAQRLKNIEGPLVREGWTQTNMVWLDYRSDCPATMPADLEKFARARGILMSSSTTHSRIVLHMDISTRQVDRVAEMFSDFFQQQHA